MKVRRTNIEKSIEGWYIMNSSGLRKFLPNSALLNLLYPGENNNIQKGLHIVDLQ